MEPPTDAEAREHRVTLRATCPLCGSQETLTLDAAQAVAWTRGKLIQVAFPDLTPAQRERLMTGYCDPCFHAICGTGE
jgi:hypothetical protein